MKMGIALSLLILALPARALAQNLTLAQAQQLAAQASPGAGPPLNLDPNNPHAAEDFQVQQAMNRGEIPRGSTVDVNKGLSSSSRTYTGDGRDGFDLGKPSGRGGVVYGGKGAAGILGGPAARGGVVRGAAGADAILPGEEWRPIEVPDVYLVRRGDTLWDLSDRYYQNPWGWPTVWKYNPQLVNPHWIYPGDQLRLRDPNAAPVAAFRPGSNAGSRAAAASRPGVLPKTVFSRDQGYLGDPKRDFWGELVGAAEDQMLLSDGNHVYLTLRPGVTLEPGQTLTIFTPVSSLEDVPGARKPPGEIVSVKGTVKVEQFNPQTRVARGSIIEALDVIERGAKIGPVRRSFDVVAPKPAGAQVVAHVLTSFYPRVFFGQHQLLFLDRGSEDGLEPGTRLFVLAQGDTWRHSLKVADGMLKDRVRLESTKVEVEATPMHGEDKEFPSEVMAELRVLRTEKYSSVALVIESKRELAAGDVASSIVGH